MLYEAKRHESQRRDRGSARSQPERARRRACQGRPGQTANCLESVHCPHISTAHPRMGLQRSRHSQVWRTALRAQQSRAHSSSASSANTRRRRRTRDADALYPAPSHRSAPPQSSLEKAKSWVKELQRQANSNIVIAFVGNKLDLVQGGASDAGDDADDDNEDDDDDDDDDASEADDATARGAAARADGGDGASEAGEGASSTRSKTRAGSGSGYGSGSAASKRQVPRAEAEAYAKEANLLFAETSAKTGEGVVEVFTEIAKTIPLDALLANSRQGGAAGGRAGGAAARAGAGGAAGAGQAQAGDRVDLTSGPGAKDGACAC